MIVFVLRWIFRLVALAAILWFALTVPLGKRTLAGHLRAIFTTSAAKDLAQGTRQGAGKIVGKVKRGVQPAKPSDDLTDEDRRALDKLIEEKTQDK